MIDIRDLVFSYQGSKHQVFSHFDLSLKPGCVYGLLSKNGTGKSTLLYIIAGLLSPNHGSVKVDGMESRLRDPELLKRVFIVPEEYVMPDMTFDAFRSMMRSFYPTFSDELLGKCLADFEMPASPNLKELSMGQKKKVYMSFAIATGTSLLMMDEPTNGLDIPSKSLFRRVVANYMTDDRTLIISTHQVHDVENLLDHVVIMDQSKVLLDSSMADISKRYAFRYLSAQEMGDRVVYSEPSLQGNASMVLRGDDEEETQVDLELLFNAAMSGKKLF
uniref:ABC transporter ATP-binding protein n=1 Tax=Prevotella sp. TaxID=59823 RepID=UPI004025B620